MQLTSRSKVGGVVAIIGALAVSCQGSSSGCVTAPGSPPAPPVLLSRYVLVSVQPPHAGTAAVPGIYDDSAGYRLRVDADTLTFAADSTYRETGQTALVASGGAVTIRPQPAPSPALRYSTGPGGAGSLTIPVLTGRSVAGVNYYGANLTVQTRVTAGQFDGPIFFFESR